MSFTKNQIGITMSNALMHFVDGAFFVPRTQHNRAARVFSQLHVDLAGRMQKKINE